LSISSIIFGAKAEELYCRNFPCFSCLREFCQKSSKLWQLAQILKTEISSKISAKLLLKYKLNTREFLHQDSTCKNVSESNPRLLG
jgi:deoxycytidylate deaminase